MDSFVGFDVSLASTAICLLSDCGRVVKEASAPSEPEALTAFLQGLSENVEFVGLETPLPVGIAIQSPYCLFKPDRSSIDC
jgi:predicted NBD/HSP70 family sugar kinase